MAIRKNPDGSITVGVIREEEKQKPEKAEAKKPTKKSAKK